MHLPTKSRHDINCRNTINLSKRSPSKLWRVSLFGVTGNIVTVSLVCHSPQQSESLPARPQDGTMPATFQPSGEQLRSALEAPTTSVRSAVSSASLAGRIGFLGPSGELVGQRRFDFHNDRRRCRGGQTGRSCRVRWIRWGW